MATKSHEPPSMGMGHAGSLSSTKLGPRDEPLAYEFRLHSELLGYNTSKGFGPPAEIIISAPYYDFR